MEKEMFREKVKPNGVIKIPIEVRRKLKWDVGDEINLFLHPGYVILKEREERRKIPSKQSITKSMKGLIKIDPKIAKEIIEAENLEYLVD